MIREMISRVVSGEDLTFQEARTTMEHIMEGRATDAQIAAFITALRMKGETVEEVAGCAQVMREKATRIKAGVEPLVDTCGTGGDGVGTFNISTAAGLVAAGAGARVAKHGNRSVSSSCGSADVLEALGVNLDLSAEEASRCIEEVGFGFLFAPSLHGAMRHAAGPRRQIGIRTMFNILGPLTNPAGAQRQVVGVYDRRLVEIVRGVLGYLGTERAMVVHGFGGLDEISISGPTLVGEVCNGQVRSFEIRPEDFGLTPVDVGEISGGTPEDNAEHIMSVLKGGKGPRRDVTLMNAAAALVVADEAADLADGFRRAAAAVDSGAALAVLEKLRAFTTNRAPALEGIG